MESKSLGSMLKDAQAAGLRWLAGVLLIVVYTGGVGYAEVRNFTLLRKTLDADLLPLAILGIVCLGILAFALPMLIHHNTEPGPHRLAAYLLYFADLVIMGANAVIDANIHTGNNLSEALQAWLTYGVPTVPIMMVFGVGALWILSPEQKERDLWAQVRAATRATLAQRVADEANSPDVNEDIIDAARALTRQIVSESLGQALPDRKAQAALPAPGQTGRPPVGRRPIVTEDDEDLTGIAVPNYPRQTAPMTVYAAESGGGESNLEDTESTAPMTTAPKAKGRGGRPPVKRS